MYTSWLSSEEAFTLWKSQVPFNKYEKSATLVSNSQALLKPLDNMVGKAWNMFASRWVRYFEKCLNSGFRKSFVQTVDIYPSIILNAFNVNGSHGCWSQSQLSLGERQGETCTSRQSIIGLTCNLTACCWTVGEAREPGEKPWKHRENMKVI